MTLVSFFTIDRREVSVTDVLAQRPAFIIGSDPRGHLVLNEPGIAPAHALVTTKQGQYFIEPRFPHLEIHVNGKRIKSLAPLYSGDAVQIGGAVLHFGQAEREYSVPLQPVLSPIPAQPKTKAITPRAVAPVQVQSAPKEIYFPRQEQLPPSRLPGFVMGTVTLLILVVVVGFGVVGSGIGGTQAADTDARYAYNDGNITLIMFDADW